MSTTCSRNYALISRKSKFQGLYPHLFTKLTTLTLITFMNTQANEHCSGPE
jgi:hypothetical protein